MELLRVDEKSHETKYQAQAGSRDTHIHDVVCIGFGATGVAFGVTLRDSNPDVKVLFLERQKKQSWEPFVRLPGELMVNSFLDDLITQTNPRSDLTFVNYLHDQGHLISFLNTGSLRPSRKMFVSYLEWCAKQFDSQVKYGSQVVGVEPVRNSKGVVSHWIVVSKDLESGQLNSYAAKRVISAVGKQPAIPEVLSSLKPGKDIVHVSEALEAIERLKKSDQLPSHIAIVGDGQHAAELFEHLHSSYDNYKVTWFTRDVLRPSSDTGFSSNILKLPTANPSDDLPPEIRRRKLLDKPPTNTPPTDLRLIESIYDLQYQQSVKERDCSKWQYQFQPNCQVVGTEQTSDSRTRLFLQHVHSGAIMSSSKSFDLIIAATGYQRTEYKRILTAIPELSEDRQITIAKDYKVNFRRGAVEAGRGIWLLDSLETGDHDDDRIFNTLSTRSQRLVESLLKTREAETSEQAVEERQSRL